MEIAASHLDETPEAWRGFCINDGAGGGFEGSWDERKGIVVCVLVVLDVGDGG